MSTRSLPRAAAAFSLSLWIAACAGARPSMSPSAPATPEPAASADATWYPSGLPSAPATDEPPIPTPSPAVSDNYLAGLRYSCDGADFLIEILDTPQHAELSDDPPAAVLRGPLYLGAVASWWLIERSDTSADYVGVSSDLGLVYLRAEIYKGAWRAVNYGDCQARAVVPDATVVTWWIRKDSWPAADDRTLRLTVRDECPGTVADRLRAPIVRSDAHSIVVVLPTEPLPLPHPHCGISTDLEQLAKVTITLDEPVGDRALFDGESWPLRSAHKRSDPILWCCG